MERIQDYAKLEQEAPEHTSIVPEATWPRKGNIEFKHVYLRYKDTNEPALEDISFSISDNEKVRKMQLTTRWNLHI